MDLCSTKKGKSKKQTTLNFGKIPVKDPPPDPDAKLGEQPKKRKKLIGQLGLGYRPHKLATPSQSVSARPTLGQSDSGKATSHRSTGLSTSRDSASTPNRAEGNARQSSPEVAVIADPTSGIVGKYTVYRRQRGMLINLQVRHPLQYRRSVLHGTR